MERRDFLAAGLVLGGAGFLGSRLPLPSASAARPRRPVYPRRLHSVLNRPAAESGIDTVVVCMMENRSFDSYFGWLARDDTYIENGQRLHRERFRVNGRSFQAYPDSDGTHVDTYRRVLAPDPDPWRACGHPDPGHGWNAGRAQRDAGFLAPGSGNDDFALGYFEAEDLPVYDALARRFMVFDRWHASLLGPTYPNREYLLSGQSGGNKTNAFGGAGFQWETIVDRLAAAGVPVADYYSDLPQLLLWGARMAPYIRPIARYFDEAARGELPNVSFVSPVFTGPNRSDDHPHGDPRAAQRFVRDAFAAFARSEHWERGLFVLTYDEWGGFFDHVPPPRLPDDRASGNDADDFRQAGFRVPTLFCSPKVRPGLVDHRLYDHTSVLRFLEWRFLGAPARGAGSRGPQWWLTRRDRFAHNPGELIDADQFDPDPGFDLDLPLHAPSAPCAGATALSLRATGDDSPFEVTEQSGYFESVGFRRHLV